MRLAVLSDIHASLPALEAALPEIEARHVDGIIVAGDILTGPNPMQVMRRLRELDCCMIRGNHENYLLRYHDQTAPDWWHTSKQWGFINWSFLQLDGETLEFVAALPEQRVVHFPGTDPIRIVHGSPRNISELIFPDEDTDLLDLSLSIVPEPVVVFGHTHLSWVMNRADRLALNPGSLSGNFTGKPGGGFAILDWDRDHWRAELCEVKLDPGLIKQSFQNSGLLAAGGPIAAYWLRSIEIGINILPRFIDYAFGVASRAGYENSAFIPDHILEQAEELFAADLALEHPTQSIKKRRNFESPVINETPR